MMHSANALIANQHMPHIWCAGCGAGIILGSVLRGIQDLGYTRENTVIVTGIGCCGKADDYVTTNAFHGTHGRALAYATGIKVANPDLHLIVIMGDGDGATIGGNHLIHAARRNVDITAIIVNNANYGMTGGQLSATTPHGKLTSTSQFGNPERDFDLCALVGAAGANYVARGTVYHVNQLDRYIRQGMLKRGFSFIEVISPCPTHFGRKNGMGDGVSMMNYLKDHAISWQQYEKKDEAEKKDHIVTGVFVDADASDYHSEYELIRKKRLDSLVGR